MDTSIGVPALDKKKPLPSKKHNFDSAVGQLVHCSVNTLHMITIMHFCQCKHKENKTAFQEPLLEDGKTRTSSLVTNLKPSPFIDRQ